SRRRHTSFSRDWSSDVCSSDLKAQARIQSRFGDAEKRVKTNGSFTPFARNTQFTIPAIEELRVSKARPVDVNFLTRTTRALGTRSEERRVGTECRYRGAPQHEK